MEEVYRKLPCLVKHELIPYTRVAFGNTVYGCDLFNMYYVYLLRSARDGRIYTGYIHDLKRRVSEHFRGSVHTTVRMGELTLIYYEAFINETDAREREGYLKTTKGKRTVKLMLKDTLAAIV